MSESHPYALLRCDACGCLADPPRRLSADGLEDSGLQGSELDASASGLGSGRGLMLFVRAGEVRYEEPPLCARCSVAIGVTALVRWAEEEEEG